jgi:subtilisin-like proprotein convertase family protein
MKNVFLKSFLVFAVLAHGCAPAAPSGENDTFSVSVLEQALSQGDYDTTVQQLSALPYLPWAYTPDGCYARAYYYSLLLASKSVASNHLYAIAPRGQTFGDRWWYHVAPMVSLDTDQDNLWVLDPVFNKTSAMTVPEWTAEMGYPNPSAQSYPTFRVHPGNTYNRIISQGLPLTDPANPDVARLKEPTFQELGAFDTQDIQEACLVMHGYIDLEPDLTQEQKQHKRGLLGEQTQAMVAKLAALGKLDGQPGDLTAACVGEEPIIENSLEFKAEDQRRAIPDNNPAGISSDILVAYEGAGQNIVVDVNIEHSYIGDLRVELKLPDGRRLTLHDRSGGNAKNLEKSYALEELDGSALTGQWQLWVGDFAYRDTGTLIHWRLRAIPAQAAPQDPEQPSQPVVIEEAAADMPLAIPDNNADGIRSQLQIGAHGTVSDLAVTVEIQHTYIGDLRVKLASPSGTIFTLHDKTGGRTKNLSKTYSIPAAVGESITGAWTLQVSDHARNDVGRLMRFQLNLQADPL